MMTPSACQTVITSSSEAPRRGPSPVMKRLFPDWQFRKQRDERRPLETREPAWAGDLPVEECSEQGDDQDAWPGSRPATGETRDGSDRGAVHSL
jgi:hypothetical protein